MLFEPQCTINARSSFLLLMSGMIYLLILYCPFAAFCEFGLYKWHYYYYYY